MDRRTDEHTVNAEEASTKVKKEKVVAEIQWDNINLSFGKTGSG